MRTLLSYSAALDAVARACGKLIGWLILPLIAVIVFDVITRKIDYTRLLFSELTIKFGFSISTVMQDMQWHFHTAILAISFGFGYLANAHVRVDVFRELTQRRTQAWMELLALVFMALPFLIVLIVYSWDLFALSWSQNEGSESMTGLNHRWFIKFFMPAGFVIALLAVLATIGRLIVCLFGSEFEQKDAAEVLEIFADDHSELEAARLAAEAALRAEPEER